jgi:hypothetical protein
VAAYKVDAASKKIGGIFCCGTGGLESLLLGLRDSGESHLCMHVQVL